MEDWGRRREGMVGGGGDKYRRRWDRNGIEEGMGGVKERGEKEAEKERWRRGRQGGEQREGGGREGGDQGGR